MKTLLTALTLCIAFSTASAKDKSIRVFVALCDNKTQGIIPVGKKIGDGDIPDANLYWGCSDGFGSYFKRSKKWKLIESQSDVSETIMRRMKLKHADGTTTLTAYAYRGSEINQCMKDFEKAAASGDYDLVALIGHNGLMDAPLVEQKPIEQKPIGSKTTDAVVLCCLSEDYFKERLRTINARPVLLTRQLMYPGAFILHDAIEIWKNGGSLNDIHKAAGKAYAKNQKISVNAATGVFAKIEE